MESYPRRRSVPTGPSRAGTTTGERPTNLNHGSPRIGSGGKQDHDDTSALAFSTLNAIKCVLGLERTGYVGVGLVRQMRSNELAEYLARNNSLWSSSMIFDIKQVYDLSWFSRALRITVRETCLSNLDSLTNLLYRLQIHGTPAHSAALVITKPPDILTAFAIMPDKPTPISTVSFAIGENLDVRPRFNFYSTATAAANQLFHTVGDDGRSLSFHFLISSDNNINVDARHLEQDIFRSNVSLLEARTALNETNTEITELKTLIRRNISEQAMLMDEVTMLKAQIESASMTLERIGAKTRLDGTAPSASMSNEGNGESKPASVSTTSKSSWEPPKLFSSSDSAGRTKTRSTVDHRSTTTVSSPKVSSRSLREAATASSGGDMEYQLFRDMRVALKMQKQFDEEREKILLGEAAAAGPTSTDKAAGSSPTARVGGPSSLGGSATGGHSGDNRAAEWTTTKATSRTSSLGIIPDENSPHYVALRNQAKQEGELTAKCFRDSNQAYKSGDRARAKELSDEGKFHKLELERLNKEASEWIFIVSNLDRPQTEVDLHGLYVQEAVERAEQALLEARTRGDTYVRFIVGRGLHSQDSLARLKPAIQELVTKYHLTAYTEPHNSGVLFVSLSSVCLSKFRLTSEAGGHI